MKNKKKTEFKNTSDKTVPVVVMSGIHQVSLPTKQGNTIHVFYNTDTNLLVVDVIAGNDSGGNEIFRQTLDEQKLLGHLK